MMKVATGEIPIAITYGTKVMILVEMGLPLFRRTSMTKKKMRNSYEMS